MFTILKIWSSSEVPGNSGLSIYNFMNEIWLEFFIRFVEVNGYLSGKISKDFYTPRLAKNFSGPGPEQEASNKMESNCYDPLTKVEETQNILPSISPRYGFRFDKYLGKILLYQRAIDKKF